MEGKTRSLINTRMHAYLSKYHPRGGILSRWSDSVKCGRTIHQHLPYGGRKPVVKLGGFKTPLPHFCFCFSISGLGDSGSGKTPMFSFWSQLPYLWTDFDGNECVTTGKARRKWLGRIILPEILRRLRSLACDDVEDCKKREILLLSENVR